MKLFLWTSVFFFFSSHSNSQWVEHYLDIKVNLAVDFINQYHGITGGWAGALPDIHGKVYYTNDKGVTWKQSLLPDSMRVLVRLQMMDEMLAYGAGANNIKSNKRSFGSGKVQKQSINNSLSKYYETLGMETSGTENYRGSFVESTDGGLSWHPKGIFPDSVYYLQELYFISHKIGFVIGASPFPQTNAIFKTTDGGNNWSYVYYFQEGNAIRDIQFFDEQNGIAIGENWITRNAFVLFSTDGGANWLTINIPPLRSVTKCAYQNSNTIFISAETKEGIGSVYKSTDKGLTWQSFRTYDDSYTRGIEILPDKKMILIYGYCIKNNLPILFTDISLNNGIDLQYTVFPEFNGYIPINSKIINEAIYITGYTRKDNGFLLFTHNSQLLSDVKVNAYMPDGFFLSQNYPNPFNPSTIISYQLCAGSQVTLKVFDLLGIEVVTLVNEEKPTGNYEVKFDGNNLSSGIYFYTLKAGEFKQTKKLILMR